MRVPLSAVRTNQCLVQAGDNEKNPLSVSCTLFVHSTLRFSFAFRDSKIKHAASFHVIDHDSTKSKSSKSESEACPLEVAQKSKEVPTMVRGHRKKRTHYDSSDYPDLDMMSTEMIP